MKILFSSVTVCLPIIFICIAFLFVNSTEAQDFVIKGRVKDAVTMAPLQGATVYIEKSSLQTKTDGNGVFSISVNNITKENLFVSNVGYKSYKTLLSNYQQGTFLKINLTSLSIKLNEVTIKDYSAATIVNKAYSSIPLNYSNKDSFYEGFYRESSLLIMPDGKENVDYIIESIIDMKKGSYSKTKSEDVIKLRNTKRIITPDSGNRGRWYGGILGPSRSDLVNMRIEFLNPRDQYCYHYKIIKDTLLYNELAYVIQFEPQNNEHYRGKMYIGVKNYAFIKIDYSLTVVGLKHHYSFYVVKPTVKKGIFSINYFPMNEKWFLNSFYHAADIDISNTRRYKYRTEYITTSIDTLTGNLFSINKNENMAFWDRLSSKDIKIDTAFWRNYKIKPFSNKTAILIDTGIKPLSRKPETHKINSKKVVVTRHLHKIITDGLIHYQYEHGIGVNDALLLSSGLISQNWKNVYPFLEIGYRNYYNLQKRFKQEKTTWNNSANYFGLKLLLSTKEKLFSFSSSDNRINPYITLGSTWGIQRQFSKHFAYNYYVGPKITNRTFLNDTEIKFGDVVDIGGSLSYSF